MAPGEAGKASLQYLPLSLPHTGAAFVFFVPVLYLLFLPQHTGAMSSGLLIINSGPDSSRTFYSTLLICCFIFILRSVFEIDER